MLLGSNLIIKCKKSISFFQKINSFQLYSLYREARVGCPSVYSGVWSRTIIHVWFGIRTSTFCLVSITLTTKQTDAPWNGMMVKSWENFLNNFIRLFKISISLRHLTNIFGIKTRKRSQEVRDFTYHFPWKTLKALTTIYL